MFPAYSVADWCAGDHLSDFSDAMPESVGGWTRRYHWSMAVSPTIKVEFDRELLERLRRRHPDKGDRELLESAARIQLGREASARVKQRFAGVPSEEIEREAAKAVREEMAAERRAGS